MGELTAFEAGQTLYAALAQAGELRGPRLGFAALSRTRQQVYERAAVALIDLAQTHLLRMPDVVACVRASGEWMTMLDELATPPQNGNGNGKQPPPPVVPGRGTKVEQASKVEQTCQRVHSAIIGTPGISAPELREQLRLSDPVVYQCLWMLRAQGVVRHDKVARTYRFWNVPALPEAPRMACVGVLE